MLVRSVGVRLKEIAYEVANGLVCEIYALQVHLLCEGEPPFGVHQMKTQEKNEKQA